MSLLISLALALLLTVLSEFAVYLCLIHRSPWHLLMYSFLINSVTNPLLNYLHIFEGYNIGGLEILVVLVEIFLISLLTEISYSRALMVSTAANIASFILGIILTF
jgi:hypothetical protein